MTGPVPLVSVIVPNYNYGRTLGLCLAAVQAQTYAPLEVVVVDDCSTDDSVQIAHAAGVEVVRTPGTGGAAAARNLGAARAHGDVLFFVDSDVALAPDAIANAVALFASDPGIGAVTGTYEPAPLIRDSLVEEYRNFHQHYWLGALEGRLTDFVHTAILAVRADVFADVGPFNPDLLHTEFSEYGSRLCARHDVRLTSAVRGRHDNDATLRTVLRKVFTRSRLHVSLAAADSRAARSVTSGWARGCAAATLTAGTLPLPLLLGPGWAAVPGLLLAATAGVDAAMYRAAARYRGPAFGVFFAGTHFLVNLTVAAGVATGVVQWLTSADYRRLHEPGGGRAARRVAR